MSLTTELVQEISGVGQAQRQTAERGLGWDFNTSFGGSDSMARRRERKEEHSTGTKRPGASASERLAGFGLEGTDTEGYRGYQYHPSQFYGDDGDDKKLEESSLMCSTEEANKKVAEDKSRFHEVFESLQKDVLTLIKTAMDDLEGSFGGEKTRKK